MAIDVSVFKWIKFVTGLETKQLPYRGDRPSVDYMGYQITTIVPQSHGYNHNYANVTGNLFDWTRLTSAEMTVSINAYSPNGLFKLNRLSCSNDWWEARQMLTSEGDDIVLVSASPPVNITGLGDETYRSRFQSDFLFNVTLTDERAIHSIKEWHLTGQFSNPVQTIESNVNWVAP